MYTCKNPKQNPRALELINKIIHYDHIRFTSILNGGLIILEYSHVSSTILIDLYRIILFFISMDKEKVCDKILLLST